MSVIAWFIFRVESRSAAAAADVYTSLHVRNRNEYRARRNATSRTSTAIKMQWRYVARISYRVR